MSSHFFSTTGVPKGVEISHYNVVANSSQIMQKRSLVADTPEGRARKEHLDLSGERWLAPLPMYHAFVSEFIQCSSELCNEMLSAYRANYGTA